MAQVTPDTQAETATDLRIKTDHRLLRAKRATAALMQIMGPYIAEGAHEDAYDVLFKEMYEADVELVSRDQMAEMDRVRDLLVKKAALDAPNPFIPASALPPPHTSSPSR